MKILFREHRGSLEDSMKTLVEIDNNAESLIEHINKVLEIDYIKDALIVERYGNLRAKNDDTRIAWENVHIVIINGYGVVGFANGPIEGTMSDTGFVHCDDYIDNPAVPECLRKFLDYARAPAHGSERNEKQPLCYADYKGQRYKLTMASRFGDVGISKIMHAEHGYDERVKLADLTNFSTRRRA